MDVSVILAHPRQKSFNHALGAAVVDALRQDGQTVRFHDLYAERFDPLLPIVGHSVFIPRGSPRPREEWEGLPFIGSEWQRVL